MSNAAGETKGSYACSFVHISASTHVLLAAKAYAPNSRLSGTSSIFSILS